MITSPSYQELLEVKKAIDELNNTNPAIHQKFLNVIQLTRQMQYGYQFLGCFMMDEEAGDFHPVAQDEYVLSVFHEQVENVKTDRDFHHLQRMLNENKQVSYANICKIALGTNPTSLVGPTLIRK
ncbi:hypothetical protein SAMN05192534_12110 [Alteribacillus persepolensis]|uniref:Uncharacterized protein n=1 Tax=Alteribacillus persepolensis TaxID=568899 RepID=A0A1G8HRB2_9BACI|nr:hypothetical protein [Alteribacillus persepolensis]SDI09021.1 hypothetical protein SAMN05192534_12110 [Alteribacillus persepolensis]